MRREIKNCYNENDEVSEVYSYDYDGVINHISLENGKKLKCIDGHYILINRDNKLFWEKAENIRQSDMVVELEETDNVEDLKKTIPVYDKVKF